MKVVICILVSLCLFSCNAQEHPKDTKDVIETSKNIDEYTFEDVEQLSQSVSTEIPQDRVKIIKRLKTKIEKEKPLIVHVFVPLCDNEHQGIVPTSASIGNGFDAPRNLYWGTSKGMKRFFKELPDWKLKVDQKNPKEFVLERCVFEKTYKNGSKVHLIMDAYRGDKMKMCLEEYFTSLAGNFFDTVNYQGNTYPSNSNADLFIFNGHNGLMDEEPIFSTNTNANQKDAVSISCISQSYFKEAWKISKSYPLVMTTGLMYPGAFCTEYIINEWALLKSAEEVRKASGKAYYKYKPKSGPNGSNNLFSTGW